MPQGRLIKRQRLPKDDRGNYWEWKDFNIGKNLTFYGKVFHLYDSDAWTRVSDVYGHIPWTRSSMDIFGILQEESEI